MEIKLSTGFIVLIKDLIGEMLGLKNEGIDVLEGNPNRNDEMVHSWMNKYESGKEITLVDVKIRLRTSKDADINFKLNFIVMFTSLMGTIKQKGVRDLKILDYITPNTNLSELVRVCLEID
ncbi:hypothetical protein Tco_0092695 [Tanacetum coccineum]